MRSLTCDTKTLAERLLFEHRVVVSPGEAFGPHSAGCFHVSYASSEDALGEALVRLRQGLARLAV